MSVIVPRTCTEIPEDDAGLRPKEKSRPLADFRTASAYVLLGDPGSGKTTSLRGEYEECKALGGDACFPTARDFLTFDPNAHPEWRGKTLFIDGLDEVRARGSDARTPFDKMRRNLDTLGKPRFRLSCREADWLGTNDRTNLARVSPDADLTVLRLDPLTDEDIEQILSARSGIDDVRSFVTTAQEKGVGGFLANPQCLNLLADVVARGEGWPASRLGLFERACLRMIREHNPEHEFGRQAPVVATDEDALLNAAGRLCAVLLISGSVGYALRQGRADADFPDLRRCGHEQLAPHRQAIATNLFTAMPDGRFQPVHRHVAEFLGARHLARLIDGRNGVGRRTGLPARRVLALISGRDGGVVTEFRGLSAWLAALCQAARSDLIERDPIGVTLYGDAGWFSTGEKVALLKSLAAESGALAEWLKASLLDPPQPVSAAGSLVTADTEAALGDILTDPRRDDAQQTLVLFILRALEHASRIPGLADALLDAVRGDGRWPGVRRRALDVLVHNGRRNRDFTASLKGLLADVRASKISDPQEDLLAALLEELYPGDLSPVNLWGYLSESDSAYFGRYFSFWRSHLVEKSPDADLADHLDVLVARQDTLGFVLKSRGLRDMPADLLARGLEAHGDHVEMKRVYDWLGVALISDSDSDAIGHIRAWLERRPAIQKEILVEGLKQCAELDDDGFSRSSGSAVRRLYGAGLPTDFGLWCLEQAEAWANLDRRIAQYFLRRAWNAVRTGTSADGFSLQVLEKRAREHDVLNGIYDGISDNDLTNQREIGRYERDHQRYRDAEEREHEEWLRWVYANETALRENHCVPSLLHQLALAYFGHLIGAEGDDPWSRLRNLFRSDRRLEKAARCGLRGAIRRDDLPKVDEIVRLRDENQEHVLALPALASLAEIHGTAPNELDGLNGNQIRTALAFYYCARGVHEPPWYRRMLGSCPDIVADALVQSAAALLRAGSDRIAGLHELARREDHAKVAQHASLRLLRAVPMRGTAKQVDMLDSLLWSALKYADKESLRKLIGDKLSRRSMDVAQRVRWLAAGLVASPNAYLEPLERFVGHHKRRAWHVAAFFDAGAAPLWRVETWRGRVVHGQTSDNSHRNSVALSLIEALGAHALERLVRLTGRAGSPDDSVRRLVLRLAALPDEKAGVALDALVSDPTLSRWHAALLRARDDQRVIRRDAAYRHPDVEQVCRTLNDGPPANAADLAALTTDRVDEIARGVRDDNANGWRPFWNEDEGRHPDTPKHEESCRDALLKELRHCLPDEVDAQPEGRYANDKRADIRISCRDFQIPVEVKKNGHRKLWSALRDQLIAQYTRDPATDGYGIYLVLWFGEVDGQRTPPPPSGVRPDGPEALKARLEEALTREEARKISVCVIDVSAPAV